MDLNENNHKITYRYINRLRQMPFWLKLSLLALLAFIVRIISLGKADLWTDEILFASRSTPPLTPLKVLQINWEQLISVTHFPLPRLIHNLILWLGQASVDDLLREPLWQRIPAVLWGAASLPLFYLLSKRVLPHAMVLMSTAMMCFFLYPIFFSREAYYYAPLMFFSTGSLYFFHCLLEGTPRYFCSAIGILVFGAGMVFSHLSGTVLQVLFLLGAIFNLIFFIKRNPKKKLPINLKLLCLSSLFPLLLISPYYFKLVSTPSPLTYPVSHTFFSILHDVVGKMCMGNHILLNLFAWIILLLGAYRLIFSRTSHFANRMLSIIIVLAMTVLTFITFQTQYAPRYFSSLAPGYYLLTAAGLHHLCSLPIFFWPGFSKYSSRLFILFGSILIGIHLFIYLPPYYSLEAKGVNYGGIARWLNKHLPTGTPYLLETGHWDLRFISGYHPTPSLLPAFPYRPDRGAEGSPTARAIDKQFLLQFPEAPWVELYRYGNKPGMDLGSWSWPHEYFKQRVDITNEPLRRLSDLGVWLQSSGNIARANDLLSVIWFNTPNDLEQIAKDTNKALLFEFPDWNTIQVSQGIYARIRRGSTGRISLKHLHHTSVRGRIRMQAGITGTEGNYVIACSIEKLSFPVKKITSGQFWIWESPAFELTTDMKYFQWGLDHIADPSSHSLLLHSIEFISSSK